MSLLPRVEMVDPTHARLSIVRQCRLTLASPVSVVLRYEGTGREPVEPAPYAVIDESVFGDAVLRCFFGR